MATEETEANDKVEKLSKVKVEKTESKDNKPKKETVNLINAISEQFGLATFDVKDMISSGTVTIDGSEWRPKDGNFNIPLDDIQGKELEIVSSPKSVKFTFDSADLNEYRTITPE